MASSLSQFYFCEDLRCCLPVHSAVGLSSVIGIVLRGRGLAPSPAVCFQAATPLRTSHWTWLGSCLCGVSDLWIWRHQERRSGASWVRRLVQRSILLWKRLPPVTSRVWRWSEDPPGLRRDWRRLRCRSLRHYWVVSYLVRRTYVCRLSWFLSALKFERGRLLISLIWI